MFDTIKADLARFSEDTDSGRFRLLVRGLLSQGFQAILGYRFFRWFHVRGLPTQPVRFIIERLIEIMTGISIPAEADIGKGLRIHHFGGIIFHSHVTIGEHCTIYQGVTLGDKGGYGEPPRVGHNVLIGAGAKVIGNIKIGDNVVIGANSLVTRDVPEGTIALGVPAKVIGINTRRLIMAHAQPSKQPIKIMQCRSTYTTGGGPDKTVLLIAEKADPAKFQHILMYMRGADDTGFQIGNWARERGLTIHEVLEHGKLDLANLKEIHQLIQQYHIDILHTRDYKTAVAAYLVSLFNPRVKLIFTSHLWQDLDSFKMKLYTWLNLAAIRSKRYQKVIAVSEALRDYMIQRGVDAGKITVIHNAIDVDVWDRTKVTSTIRAEFNIPPSAKIAGVVGRLRYEKDLPTTLKVAEKISAQQPDTYFLIVGDGPERQEVEQHIQQMGLSDKILLLGFRKDMINVYAGMDVFFSTARTEGTPNTALEAMSMGTPVVYTDVGGVGELIQDGHDGLLFQVGDVEGIAEAVLSFLTDEEKAKTFRERVRQTVCTKFSFANRLQAVEAVYEEVMGLTIDN